MDLVITSITERDRLEYVRPSDATTRRQVSPGIYDPVSRGKAQYEAQITNFDDETADLVEFRLVLSKSKPLELPDKKMRLTPDGKLEFPLISPLESHSFVARSLGNEATIVLKRKK